MDASTAQRVRTHFARWVAFLVLFVYLLLQDESLSDALWIVLGVFLICVVVSAIVRVLVLYMAEGESFLKGDDTLDKREAAVTLAFGVALYMLWDYGRRENKQDLLYCLEENEYEVAQQSDVLPLVRRCLEVDYDDDWYDDY